VVATVAWRRDYGLLATPDSFRLNQNPLGAIHLPQALTSVGTSVTGGPFASQAVVALSTTRVVSRTIPFILTECLALR